jgi:hypothetical protein
MNPRDLQDALKRRLLESDAFAIPPAIPVHAEYIADLAEQITQALDQVGCVVIIREPEILPEGNVRGLVRARVMIEVSQQPLDLPAPSGSQRDAIAVAAEAAAVLTWGDRDQCTPWDPEGGWSPIAIRGITAVNLGAPLIYRLTVESIASL